MVYIGLVTSENCGLAQVECYFMMDLLFCWLVVLLDIFTPFDTMLDMPNTND